VERRSAALKIEKQTHYPFLKRRITMSTKAKIAAIAALLAALAAPQISFAQQAIFLPDAPATQSQLSTFPGDAHASVVAPTRHRGQRAAVRSDR
jgi:hypothetical protein